MDHQSGFNTQARALASSRLPRRAVLKGATALGLGASGIAGAMASGGQ